MLKRADAPFDEENILDTTPSVDSVATGTADLNYRRSLEAIQDELRRYLGDVIFRLSSVGAGPDEAHGRIYIAVQGEYVQDVRMVAPWAEVRPLTAEEYAHDAAWKQDQGMQRIGVRLFDPAQLERAA